MSAKSTARRIRSVTRSVPTIEGAGVHLKRGFGYSEVPEFDPFLMLDDFHTSKPSEYLAGFPWHPHRGIETITYLLQGLVEHGDSMGNKGVIGAGDVQWMTAGSGILHKEYHETEYSKKGGPFQMVQLWVNLPAKDKMTPPKYQALENSQLGKYQLPDDKGVVEVIAGEFNGVKGPATIFTPMHVYTARLKKGAGFSFFLPEKFNTGILMVDGSMKINEEENLPVDHFAIFRNDGTEIKIKALEDAVFLVLSGKPINEPIVPYGPFLMNTKEEIMQAFSDLNSGKFGVLED